MSEQLRDVKIKLVIETNKSTFERDFEISDYGDPLDLLQDFLDEIRERLGIIATL